MVQANWPAVCQALADFGQHSRNGCIAALATIAVETGGGDISQHFTPRHELYNDPPGAYAYFEGMYGIGHHPDAYAMGNRTVGDGAKYPGRGYVQITWHDNYLKGGIAIGIPDLVDNPDRAMEPAVAAKLLAWYFAGRDIKSMAERGDWTAVRQAVQGGTLGLDHLIQVVTALLA